MNKISIIFVAIVLIFTTVKADEPDQYQEKVKTLDSTLATLYGVISGEAGEERDWDLFHYLFAADARLIPSFKDKEGKITYQSLTPAGYVERSGKWLVENGFYEIEIAREVDKFGPVVQVFSTYESYHSKKDKEPFMRGINSIQLLNDGERWWVLNIYWSQESEENPIPKQYLPK